MLEGSSTALNPSVSGRLKPENQPDDKTKELSRLTKEQWREYTKSVWQIANTRHPEHPAVFPVEIPTRLVRMFSFHGETVLDPFCGIGTTGDACIANGRRFVGYDTNRQYASMARKRLAELGGESVVKCGSSDNMADIENASMSLVVTSPPYWDKADYGTHKKNIGSISNYGQFLEAAERIFVECYRVLRQGRRMCIVTANVHQNTSDGLLTFPLNADFASICRHIGFRLANEIIWSKDGTGGRWGSHGKQRPIFGSYPYPPNFLFKNVHEYILIFRKPPVTGKNSKAPEYGSLVNHRSLPLPRMLQWGKDAAPKTK